MIEKKSAGDLMAQARTRLLFTHPYFGGIALRMDLMPDPYCATLWIDGRRIGYNPEFIENYKLEEVKTKVGQLTLHYAAKHHLRRGSRKNRLWQRATDFAVNPILKSENFHMPDDALLNDAYSGMSAEQIYKLLDIPGDDGEPRDEGDPGDKEDPGDGGGQGDDNQDQEQDQDKDQDKDDDQDQKQDQDQDKDGQGQDQNQQGQGQPGKTPGGNPADDPGQMGEVRDAPPPDDENPNDPEQEWEIVMRQAVNQAKAAGNLPGGLEEFIEAELNPSVHWREPLKDFVETVAKNDYSWQRPNRRYVQQGIYLPEIHSRELGTLFVFIDTSSSMGTKELEQSAAELSGILEEFKGVVVKVAYCDTVVYEEKTEEFTSADLPIVLHAYGGGGTNFKPAFDYIEKLISEGEDVPRGMIYFTDMECFDAAAINAMTPPDYMVLWAGTGSNGLGAFQNTGLPFGRYIEIDFKHPD